MSPHCATAASSTLAEHVKDEEIVERSEAATVVASVAFPDTAVDVSSPLDDAAVVVELDDAAVVVVVELDAAAVVVVVVAATVVVVVVVVMP